MKNPPPSSINSYVLQITLDVNGEPKREFHKNRKKHKLAKTNKKNKFQGICCKIWNYWLDNQHKSKIEEYVKLW